MGEMTPQEALEKLVISPIDRCKVIVVTMAPGLNQEQQAQVASGITQVLGYVLEFEENDTGVVDFVTQTDIAEEL